MDNQTPYRTQCEENGKAIADEIELLKQFLEDSQFKDFWQCVKVIGTMFKELKPLARETREELWKKYRAIIDLAIKQRERREFESNVAKHQIHGEIMLMTGTDTPLAWNPFDFDEVEEGNMINESIKKARGNLSIILEKIKSLKGVLIKEDHQFCWEKWKEASDRLNDLYVELCDHCYYRLDADIRHVWNDAAYSPEPKEVLEEIKAIQTRLHKALLKRDQREELRDNLNQAWNEAISRLNAMRNEKHDAWVSRTEDWINNRQENLEKNQSWIARLEGIINDLRDKISSSTHDNWIEKAEGWIEEHEAKISEIEGWNAELEAEIEKNQRLLDEDEYRRR